METKLALICRSEGGVSSRLGHPCFHHGEGTRLKGGERGGDAKSNGLVSSRENEWERPKAELAFFPIFIGEARSE